MCNPDYRGRGYASRLVEALGKTLPTRQCVGKKCVASVLFLVIQPKLFKAWDGVHFQATIWNLNLGGYSTLRCPFVLRM